MKLKQNLLSMKLPWRWLYDSKVTFNIYNWICKHQNTYKKLIAAHLSLTTQSIYFLERKWTMCPGIQRSSPCLQNCCHCASPELNMLWLSWALKNNERQSVKAVTFSISVLRNTRFGLCWKIYTVYTLY